MTFGQFRKKRKCEGSIWRRKCLTWSERRKGAYLLPKVPLFLLFSLKWALKKSPPFSPLTSPRATPPHLGSGHPSQLTRTHLLLLFYRRSSSMSRARGERGRDRKKWSFKLAVECKFVLALALSAPSSTCTKIQWASIGRVAA